MTVVLITGALAGIGRATALSFAKEGAQLVVSGRQPDAGQSLWKSYARAALRRAVAASSTLTDRYSPTAL